MEKNKEKNYKVIRSRRKTLSLSINQDLEVTIKSPLYCPNWVINDFYEKNKKWIEKRITQESNKILLPQVLDEDIPAIKKEAYEILSSRTKYYSQLMGLEPSYVKISSAKKRFGSCNGKNGITYSYRLIFYPKKAIDYVIIHELAHIKHKNHQKEFYQLIKKYMPDYKEAEALLKAYR